jgi:multiple sugar transport system substrate-binding protein
MTAQTPTRWTRRTIVRLLGATAVVPLLAACAGSASPTAAPAQSGASQTAGAAPAPTTAPAGSTGAAPAAAKPATSAADSFKGVSITVAVPAGTEANVTEKVKTQYEQATGAKANVTAIPTVQLQQKVSVELVAGTGAYDVVDISPWWNGTMAPRLLPLNDFLTDGKLADPAFDLNDFDPALLKQYSTWEGKTVGFPSAADVMMLFYRTDLFDDAGQKDTFKARYGRELTVPKSYEEYDQVAEFFTQKDKGIYGTALMAKRSHQSGAMWINRFLSYGGQYFDDKKNPTIADDKGVKALEHYVKEVKFAPEGALTYESPEAIAAFLGGKTAMLETWPGTPLVDSQNPEKSQIVGKLGTALIPGGHACAGGWYFAVAKDSKNPQAAYKFVEMRSNKANVKLALLEGGRMPGRKSAYQDADVVAKFPKGYAENFYQALVGSTPPMNTSPVDDELKTRLDEFVSSAVAGQKTAKEALQQLTQVWVDAMKRGAPVPPKA